MGLELGGTPASTPALGVPAGNPPSTTAPTINLSKGQKISLEKVAPGLKNMTVGLGWDVNTAQGNEYDLDVEAFLLGENGKCLSASHFIFYRNPSFGGVQHMGDNKTGAGDGDDEQINFSLDSVPAEVHKIIITATIHEAIKRKQNFGQVNNAYIRLLDGDKVLCKFDLTEDYSTSLSLEVAEIYRHNGEWKFNPSGNGFDVELSGLLQKFGLA